MVFKGESVRFFVTASGLDTACFNIPEKNIFSLVKSQKITESEVLFDKIGNFQFNCPGYDYVGKIAVIAKPSQKVEEPQRSLASEKVKVWKPKDSPIEWEKKREVGPQLPSENDIMNLDQEEE